MENKTFAAVMTGKGTGAISTVQICGENAESVIRKIYKPASTKQLQFETGQILFGTIHDNSKKIDQVIIGCEGPSSFSIHCHGNPLIVEMIIQLLEKKGVQILNNEQLQIKLYATQEQTNTIALEAKIAQAQALTIEGTKIILHQIDSGLSKTVREWLSNINDLPLDLIRKQADGILQNSSIANFIISGCKTILTGPPNTGKSTLLNCLCGKQKSIVTDISGTTRDWVTAKCQIESLPLELFDTAGLDEKLSIYTIDNASQKKTLELINQADLIILVLDGSRDIEFDYSIYNEFTNKKILTVLNKSDLTQNFIVNKLPAFLSTIVRISAKKQTGIDDLAYSIRRILGVNNFNVQTPICFTDRQKKMIEKLRDAESTAQVATILKVLQNSFC